MINCLFALKFLKSEELNDVAEVIKVTELGKMIYDDGVKNREKELCADMLKDNIPLEQILKFSKLTIEEVESIKKELNL